MVEKRKLSKACDGVVCFAGVDWWYHAHGHSECQIMRRLAPHMTVLWVNSIGMRTPRPGRTEISLRRYVRKAKSTLKGLRRDPASGMWIYSPIFVPRYTPGWLRFNGRLLAWQTRLLCSRLRIRNPACWVTVPTVADAVERGDWGRVVFNRCDEFSKFPHADEKLIAALEQRLLATSDAVLYVSRLLFDRERDHCRHAEYIGHGVDYEHFRSAHNVSQNASLPEKLRTMLQPVVGFYGSLDDWIVDKQLLVKVARRISPATLLIIGPKAMDTATIEAEPNVVYVGLVPYADLPAYAGLFGVALMPWRRNEWIKSCNPVKLKEYLAIGCPIVSMRFPELKPYEHLVYVADSHEQFLASIDRALAEKDPGSVIERRRSVAESSWDAVAGRVAELLHVTVNCRNSLDASRSSVGSMRRDDPT